MTDEVATLLDEIKRLYREKLVNLFGELTLLGNEPQTHLFRKTTYKVELTAPEWSELRDRYLSGTNGPSIRSVEFARLIFKDITMQAIEAEQRKEQKVYQMAWNKLYDIISSPSLVGGVLDIGDFKERMDRLLTECRSKYEKGDLK